QGQRVKQRLYSSPAEETAPFREEERSTFQRAGEERTRESPRTAPAENSAPASRENRDAATPFVAREQEVPRESLLKGYEVKPQQYVAISPEELKALEEDANRHAEIQEFVPLDAVDPVFFEKTYYLGPDKDNEKVYWLLGRALRERKSGAIAKLVMRGKEKVVFIRPTKENRLILEVLYWGDEIRDFQEIHIPEVTLRDQEVSLAGQLVESLSSKQWNPQKYHDTYRERVLDLIQKKEQGEQIVSPAAREPAPIVDLMEALKKSLSNRPATKKQPARAQRARATHKPPRQRRAS
ncbi:MAG TPA: Ku protein, partial [Nitrospirales bacterium]